METTKTLEFNPIKVIKLINKEQILQRVHINHTGEYVFNTLLNSAEKNTLTPKEIESLETIFKDVVLVSDRHKELYEGIKMSTKSETPRRYGKTQVLNDIKTQGGKATPFQETALEIADLKAIAGTLNIRITSDRYKGTEKLSEEKQRKIKAAIRDFKIKLGPILKQK